MNNAMEFLLEQTKEREDQAVLALNKARSELEDYYRQVSKSKSIVSITASSWWIVAKRV